MFVLEKQHRLWVSPLSWLQEMGMEGAGGARYGHSGGLRYPPTVTSHCRHSSFAVLPIFSALHIHSPLTYLSPKLCFWCLGQT